MVSPWAILAYALATSRVTYMVAREDGPANVFLLWRTFLYKSGGWVAKGFDCPLCLSFWVAPILWLLPLELSFILAVAELVRIYVYLAPSLWE
jgi:hypothetical protein